MIAACKVQEEKKGRTPSEQRGKRWEEGGTQKKEGRDEDKRRNKRNASIQY